MNWHLFKRPLSLRALALLAACVMIMGSAAGGTLAWLVNKTAPVTNVFTSSFIDVELTESDTDDDDEDPGTNSYVMLPGASITKDPVVTVIASSEDAWLFVKLDKSDNFDTFLAYDMADGWTVLDSDASVFWRKVSKADTDQAFAVIRDNTVLVQPNVTAYMLNTLSPETRPTLTVTAYAVQQTGVETAEAAWALALSESMNP